MPPQNDVWSLHPFTLAPVHPMILALTLAILGTACAAEPPGVAAALADTLEIQEWKVPWENTRPRDPTVAVQAANGRPLRRVTSMVGQPWRRTEGLAAASEVRAGDRWTDRRQITAILQNSGARGSKVHR